MSVVEVVASGTQTATTGDRTFCTTCWACSTLCTVCVGIVVSRSTYLTVVVPKASQTADITLNTCVVGEVVTVAAGSAKALAIDLEAALFNEATARHEEGRSLSEC